MHLSSILRRMSLLFLLLILVLNFAWAGKTGVIILAGGQGTRMSTTEEKQRLEEEKQKWLEGKRKQQTEITREGDGEDQEDDEPKIMSKSLRLVAGKSMISRILEATRQALPDSPIAVAVAYDRKNVIRHVQEQEFNGRKYKHDPNLTLIYDHGPKGTGYSVRYVMEHSWFQSRVQSGEITQVLVLLGDMPMLTPELLRTVTAPLDKKYSMRMTNTLMTPGFPLGYGRVVRDPVSNEILRVVECKNATPAELDIREVSASTFLFPVEFLQEMLPRIQLDKRTGEYLLTELVQLARDSNKDIDGMIWANNQDLLGANTQQELQLLTDIWTSRQ